MWLLARLRCLEQWAAYGSETNWGWEGGVAARTIYCGMVVSAQVSSAVTV